MPRLKRTLGRYNNAFEFPPSQAYKNIWKNIVVLLRTQYEIDGNTLYSYGQHPPNRATECQHRIRIQTRHRVLQQFLASQYPVSADPITQLLLEHRAVWALKA